jgi:glycosyltransferase involved in cell wall biosynthesis
LIPAFNAEEWISDTIKSAIGQTWPEKEVIIVDDGSTDQTLSVARKFASKSVSVLSQKNQGAAAARNTALSVCQGDYIQWLDADDLLHPEKISRQMSVLAQRGSARALLSSEWGRFMYRIEKAEFTPTALWCDLCPAEWLTRKMEENLHMQTATWLVSRDLTEAAGPWDARLLGDDDGEYFCRVKLAADGIQFVRGAKVFYRMPGFNRLSYIGKSRRKLETQFISMQLHIAYLRTLDDGKRARAACVQYLQNWLPHFYPESLDILQQAQELAKELGGALEFPRLPWKYAWLQRAFGWRSAKRAQLLLPCIRWSTIRHLDKALFHFDKARRAQ